MTRTLALILSRKLLWFHQMIINSFAKLHHLLQDLILNYSSTCLRSSQHQKITLLLFRQKNNFWNFKIHCMTKSFCIHYSNDSIALMLFKNYLNDKIIFVRLNWQQILNVFWKMLQSNFLQMRICQTHQSVAGIQILEQMER